MERPILFSAPMVRALLDGSKTQTRRLYKVRKHPDAGCEMAASELVRERQDVIERICPYGQPGDRLWVRETHFNWWKINPADPTGPRIFSHAAAYAADGYTLEAGEKWIPSIHMLRGASRINLEITGVRVERLNNISEADADAEGCERLDSERVTFDPMLCDRCGGTRLHRALGPNGGVIDDVDCVECDTYAKRYKHLWESINGAGSWAANPWVWVVEFKRVTP